MEDRIRILGNSVQNSKHIMFFGCARHSGSECGETKTNNNADADDVHICMHINTHGHKII